MEAPAFPDDRHRRSLGGKQEGNLCVRRGLDLRPARAPKGAYLCRAPFQMLCRVEKRNILRIGSGPSAFDILNPKRIELFSDSNLVLNAERYTLGLRAVA